MNKLNKLNVDVLRKLLETRLSGEYKPRAKSWEEDTAFVDGARAVLEWAEQLCRLLTEEEQDAAAAKYKEEKK